MYQQIIERFTQAWGDLASSLVDDYGCTMTCAEADALADVFRSVGEDNTAEAILESHARTDDAGDGHFHLREG